MRFNQGKNNVLQWRDADKHFKLRSKMAAGYSGREFSILDVISDLAFDQPFGFMETDSDVYEHIKITKESLTIFMETTVFCSVILASDKDRLGFGKMMGIDKKVAAERFGPGKKNCRLTHHGHGNPCHVITNPRVLAKLLAETSSAPPFAHRPVTIDAEARGLLYV
ncbi:pisatin demethylase [Colletotrichum tabaci]|uniref:Pisatin demethylase n=1 Tax=Colletotrichum tabaci TaxID=1209068 RepID=A0AAV9TCV0_9PEZI